MQAGRLFAVAASCVVLIGCGSGSEPREPVYPVRGVVKVKGTPVYEARVVAVPVGPAAAAGTRFEALTDDKGEFLLSTYANSDGIPLGQYDIRISWPDIARGRGDRERETDQLNGRYNDPKKPAFTIEVRAGDNTLPPFDLK